MAIIKYHNVGISAMSACVPSKVVSNRDLGYLIPEEEIEKTINNIGIEERRVVEDDVCASDLCYKAAKQLMEDNNIDPNSIDVLLFMSQTSDYRIPATAPIIQHRLGLSKDTCCLDLSLGCSGFVFALSTAFAYASMEGVHRVLLLDGETFSKICNKRDKVDWPLYGDGATATLIEKGDFEESTFILKSDGSGANAVIIPGGGMRNPVAADSLVETVREEGNIRNDLQIYMDGMDVFNFAMSVVPKGVKEIAKETNTTLDDIDWLVFHQANKFMLNTIRKVCALPKDKFFVNLEETGNTVSSTVMIGLKQCLEAEAIHEGMKVMVTGFGVGLSWGGTILKF